MKIINKTHWRTDQIRAILSWCAKMELESAQRRQLIVTISYRHRGGGCSGTAWYNSGRAIIRVSSDVFDTKDFAHVACHEFAHCRGMRHREMPKHYRRGIEADQYVAWAMDFVVEKRIQSKPLRPTFNEKISHVALMLKRAETRLRRAQTILKRWRKREKYYLKMATAQKARMVKP